MSPTGVSLNEVLTFNIAKSMIGPPPGTRVYLACGVTDMRRGFDSLCAQVQSVLNLDPYLCIGRHYVAEAS